MSNTPRTEMELRLEELNECRRDWALQQNTITELERVIAELREAGEAMARFIYAHNGAQGWGCLSDWRKLNPKEGQDWRKLNPKKGQDWRKVNPKEEEE